MTPNQAKKLCAIALAACPTAASFLDEKSVALMQEAWSMLLEDIDPEAGAAALKRYLADPANAGKLPSPGHLRGIADAAVHGRTRDGGDAYGDIAKLQRASYSAHRPAPASAWSDARARWAFDRLGGWTTWAGLEVGASEAAFRKQFIDLYNSTARHDATERSVAGLPGVARIAIAGPPPVAALVGDVAKALTAGGGR